MLRYPTRRAFEQGARTGHYFSFLEEISEITSPHELYRRLSTGKRAPSFLLESGRVSPATGRYTFILPEAFLRFRSRGTKILIEREGRSRSFEGSPFRHLRDLLRSFPTAGHGEDLPPFLGGAAGLLSYELKNQIEKPRFPVSDPYGIPDMDLGFFDAGIILDRLENRSFVFVLEKIRDGRETTWSRARARLRRLAEVVEHHARSGSHQSSPRFVPRMQPAGFDLREADSVNREQFVARVVRAKEYIRVGEAFQVNLSHCLAFDFDENPLEVYRRQSCVNPSPFSAYAEFGDYRILCGSPERLLCQRGPWVSTRPIAGTRPHTQDPVLDRKYAEELFLNPKERAEHIMLIDLERNDLGRVCQYGSVRVDEMMRLETYSHVHHIISNVTGRLAPERDILDALRSVFPGGTITGAPKVRAMEIIDELEGQARGPYTGSLGYIGFNGSGDWNIVIRSLMIQGSKAYLQVGAGIVADSNPEGEYQETLDKAQAFLQTLGCNTHAREAFLRAH